MALLLRHEEGVSTEDKVNDILMPMFNSGPQAPVFRMPIKSGLWMPIAYKPPEQGYNSPFVRYFCLRSSFKKYTPDHELGQNEDLLRARLLLCSSSDFWVQRKSDWMLSDDIAIILLWEVYGHNLSKFLGKAQDGSDIPTADILAQLVKLVQGSSQGNGIQLEAGHQELVHDFHALIKSLPSEFSELLKSAILSARSVRLSSLKKEPEFPMFKGFRQYMTLKYHECLNSVLNRITTFRQGHPTMLPGRGTRTGEETKLNQSSIDDIEIMFSVAGSGKTTRIFDLLSRVWGFYLLPFSLPPPQNNKKESLSQQNEGIYLPRRGGGSRDTWTLFEGLGCISEWPKAFAEPTIELNCKALIKCRHDLLSRLLELEPAPTPAEWLFYQTSCTRDNDPFDRLFRMARLQLQYRVVHGATLFKAVSEYHWATSGMQNVMRLHSSPGLYGSEGSPLLYCVDEAQYDLEKREMGITTCQAISQKFLEYAALRFPLPSLVYQRFIISGTSLRLQEAKLAAQQVRLFGEPKGDRLTLVHSGFKLLNTDKEFLDILDAHPKEIYSDFSRLFQYHNSNGDGLCSMLEMLEHDKGLSRELCENLTRFYEIHKDQQPKQSSTLISDAFSSLEHDLRETISKHSQILRGRHRWSIIYVQGLLNRWLQRSFAGQLITHRDVKEQSDMAVKIAKDGLKYQLIRIENANYETISKAQDRVERKKLSDQLARKLNDLFWTAVNANLLNKPRALNDKESGYWISEGFALVEAVEEKAVTMVLAERLAVDAVIEYVKSEQSGYWYDEQMTGFINAQQNSKTSIGEGAEIYLAWNFDTELEDPSICAQNRWRIPTRRRDILSLFGRAESTNLSCVDDMNRLIDKKPGLLDFVIDRVELPKIGLQQPRFWEWLAKIRQGERCRSTFHFPDNKAGPDICFALTNKEHTECILCVIQLKTGKVGNIQDAVNTINPGMWFSSVPASRANIQAELQTDFWQRTTILRILVVAAASPRKRPRDFGEDGIGRENDFFLLLNQEHTKTLFGLRFAALLSDLGN